VSVDKAFFSVSLRALSSEFGERYTAGRGQSSSGRTVPQ